MSSIKGIEIYCNLKVWSLGFTIDFGSDYPSMLCFDIGCFDISINKPQYFKNGLFKWEWEQ